MANVIGKKTKAINLMPNGFHGSEKKWEALESPLPEIDAALELFSQSKNLNINKNYHNWPNRSLSWESQGINRKIEIYLETGNPKTYNICLYSWQDKDGNRYWKKEFLKEKATFSEILNNLQNLLKESYTIVESWSENDLEKT